MLNKILVDKLKENLNDPDWTTRETAIKALGEIGGPDILDTLLEKLKDRDRDVRLSVIQTLNHFIDSEKIIKPLRQILNNKHETTKIRSQIIEIFSKIDNPEIIQTLIDMLEDWDEVIRELAMVKLGELKPDSIVDKLIPLLRDKSNKVREKVIFVLGEIKDEKAIPPLINRLKANYLITSSGVQDLVLVKTEAIKALGKIGSKKAVSDLIEYITDKYPEIRKAVIIALENIGESKSVEYIIDSLWDEDKDVKKAAISAISKMGYIDTIEELLTILEYGYKDQEKDVLKIFKNITEKLSSDNYKVGNINKLENIISRTKEFGEKTKFPLKNLTQIYNEVRTLVTDITLTEFDESGNTDIVIFEEK